VRSTIDLTHALGLRMVAEGVEDEGTLFILRELGCDLVQGWHLGRPMAVVIMIEMIFLLSVFAEIAITTNGGPGNASTNLTYMIFKQSLMNFDVGVASAGALFAVILANIVAAFLIRIIGKNLD